MREEILFLFLTLLIQTLFISQKDLILATFSERRWEDIANSFSW